MGRVICIDYGRKRCGVAVTDILRIAANPLPVVRSCDLMAFLKQYVRENEVDVIVVGEPRDMQGNPSESNRYIEPFLRQLAREIPDIAVERFDERFTSVQAHRDMIAGGFKRSDRQRKGLADEMSAALILTAWLERRMK